MAPKKRGRAAGLTARAQAPQSATARKRVGFVLECTERGPDQKVLEKLLPRIRDDIDPVFMTERNKDKLLANCGQSARALLNRGCVRVFIVWDERPAWPEMGEALDCKPEYQQVMAAMAAAKVARKDVVPVCIREELEAWLLCDGTAIRKVIERPTHPIKPISGIKNPDTFNRPKRAGMMPRFEQNGRSYDDSIHAGKIAEHCDLSLLRRSQSFRRLEDRLRAI